MEAMNFTSEYPPVDDSAKGIPKSEYIYVTLTAVTAGLSIVGGIAICALYFAFKDIRTPGRKVLLFLAFTDALLAFGNLLGILWYLYSNSDVINKSDVFCDFQSAMTIYFSMTSFAWTVIMASCLFATVVLGKPQFTTKFMPLFHVIAWIPPGVIVIVALSLDVLGTDTTLESASWCWIDPRKPNTLLWQFVTGKFVEIVAYITTVVLYASIKIFLRRQEKRKMRMVLKRNTQNDVISDAIKKLTFVPLVFIVCRIWGTVRFLIGNFGHSIVNEPYVTWISPLQGIGDSAQGFANFVLYCYSTETIRRRMLNAIGYRSVRLHPMPVTRNTGQTASTKKNINQLVQDSTNTDQSTSRSRNTSQSKSRSRNTSQSAPDTTNTDQSAPSQRANVSFSELWQSTIQAISNEQSA